MIGWVLWFGKGQQQSRLSRNVVAKLDADVLFCLLPGTVFVIDSHRQLAGFAESVVEVLRFQLRIIGVNYWEVLWQSGEELAGDAGEKALRVWSIGAAELDVWFDAFSEASLGKRNELTN